MGSYGELLKEYNDASATAPVTDSSEKVEKRSMTRSFFKCILRMVFPDQRKNERHQEPPLVGHLGMAHASKPYELTDISISGFCLLTDERWERGTEMPITLRRTDSEQEMEPESFTVQATVVRYGAGGVAFSIALSEEDSHAVSGNSLRVRWISRDEMQDFLNRMKETPADETGAKEEAKVGPAVSGESGLKAVFGD